MKEVEGKTTHMPIARFGIDAPTNASFVEALKLPKRRVQHTFLSRASGWNQLAVFKGQASGPMRIRPGVENRFLDDGVFTGKILHALL